MLRTQSYLFRALAILLAGWAASPARAAEPPQLALVDGSLAPAQLKSIAADGQLSFQIEAQSRQLAPTQLVYWGRLPAMSGDAVALLSDGGQLASQLVSADQQTLRFDSAIFGEISIPRANVRAVLLRAPADFEARDQLTARATIAERAEDWLLLDNGDELTGTVQSIDSDVVQLESQVGPTPIELNRVVAIALATTGIAQPPTAARIIAGFVDGSWFSVLRATTTGDGSRLEIEAATGWQAKCLTEDLAYLQPLAGSARYLSDLPAAGYKHIPFLKTEWPFTADRSVAGGLLRYDDQVYPKGIGMHSTSRLTYDLSPDDRRFAAEIALDASAQRRGSVSFRVFVDSEQRYASPVVRGGDAPIPISVDVNGGKRVSLIVDFAERGDELDRANWLNARLLP